MTAPGWRPPLAIAGIDPAALPPVLSPAGLLTYGVGGVLTVILLAHAVRWWRQRPETGEDDSSRPAANGASSGPGEGVARRQQDAAAPASIEWESRAAKVGDEWTATLYIDEYPDMPTDGYLSGLFECTDVAFDLTARIVPKHQGRARDRLRRAADDRQADADLEDTVRGGYLQEQAAEAAATYTAVENGERVFDQEIVVTVRADTRDELRTAVNRVRGTLRDPPADLEPKPAICRQDLALQSAAPVGPHPLEERAVALGGAVGALLASPHEATILEDDGVEFGSHKDTDTPIVIDPFAREDGYAMVTVGDPGSGKSFQAKQNFIRTLARDPDRIGVILEPLNDWHGVADALGGRHVTVGGTLGLNPLEIRPAHERDRTGRGADASPLKEKRNRVVSFFTTYFALRDVELGDRRTTLEVVIDTVYERAGITDAVATHYRESPTVRDMLDVLEELSSDPSEFVVRSPAEAMKLKTDAVWLLDQLRPFAEGGQFANLGRESEFDIHDEKVLYLDLVQQGGSIDAHTSLLMELLISLVYERAKETDKEVVFVIDEARYLMKDAETLEHLETIFRHHRHHDLSIRLVTQTVDEFLTHDISKIILDQCAIKQFHKLDGMNDEIADVFGLNDAQKRYVQTAQPGEDEAGYSEALVGVDGEWRGVRVEATPSEIAVIDNDLDALNHQSGEPQETEPDDGSAGGQAADSIGEWTFPAVEGDDD